MPDARYYNGPDDRDFDADDPTCPDCGAGPDEGCDVTCECAHCTGRRTREAALRALDVEPETAA